MSALNKVYRPRNISELIGQPHIVEQLTDLIEDDRVPGVIACIGLSGHGKTSLARVIARRVNCLDSEEADSCGECKNCILSDKNAMSDVMEMNSATDRGINFVRSLAQKIRYAPKHGGKRVYIFDEAHSITKQAMEAMLKMLEDHPPHVMFILCTTEPQALTATLLQRCKQFHFKTIDPEVIAKDLLRPIARAEKWKLPLASLQEIAEHGDGIPRICVSLLESVGASLSRRRKLSPKAIDLLVQKAIKAMGWKPPKRSAVNFVRAVITGDNTEAFKLLHYERADLVLRAVHDLCIEAVKVQANAGGRKNMTAGLHVMAARDLLAFQALALRHLQSVVGLQGGFSPINSAILGAFIVESLAAMADSKAVGATPARKESKTTSKSRTRRRPRS